MSYILDALRRAQAERERGQVPGLEARTLVMTPTPPPQRRAAAWWLGGALAVGLLGVAAVLALRGGAAPATAPAVAQAPTPTPALAPTPTPTPTAPVALPAPPAPMVVVSAPAASPPGATPMQAPAPPLAVAPPTPISTAAAPTPVPVPVTSAVRPVQLAQLSPDLRRELPTLVLGGAIWSDNAASRFVIVNGQVLREGDAAAPGVMLERIGPKAVFLRWRDWRVEVPI